MSLHDLEVMGACTDEWARWQQGGCGTYAIALQELNPALKYGSLDGDGHFFAHDDTWAYDSAGRHPMPYRGLTYGPADVSYGHGWKWMRDWWHYDSDEIAAAKEHAERNSILEGRYTTAGPS